MNSNQKYVYHIHWVFCGVELNAAVIAPSCEVALEILGPSLDPEMEPVCVKIDQL